MIYKDHHILYNWTCVEDDFVTLWHDQQKIEIRQKFRLPHLHSSCPTLSTLLTNDIWTLSQNCNLNWLDYWLGVNVLPGQPQVCCALVIGSENIKLNMTSWILWIQWRSWEDLHKLCEQKVLIQLFLADVLQMIKERRDLVFISRNGIQQSIIWPSKAW